MTAERGQGGCEEYRSDKGRRGLLREDMDGQERQGVVRGARTHFKTPRGRWRPELKFR